MREVRWHPDTVRDLLRIPARQRAKIKVLTEVYLAHVPPGGSIKQLKLGRPWGAIGQLAIDDYRVLFEEYDDEGFVEALLVFHKPVHVDTLTALKSWLGESLKKPRRKR